jgi:hypothetical protein
VDGGVVIEVNKPKGRCRFRSLVLVIDGERLPLEAAGRGFFRGKEWVNHVYVEVYSWWGGNSGLLFFKSTKPVDPTKILVRGVVTFSSAQAWRHPVGLPLNSNVRRHCQ